MTEFEEIGRAAIAMIMLIALLPFLFELMNITLGFPILIGPDQAVSILQWFVGAFVIFVLLKVVSEGF